MGCRTMRRLTRKRPRALWNAVNNILQICEAEIDFWPDARRFMNVGEAGLAFEGIYIYLLSRDDLWKQHHALIKKVKDGMSDVVDFDELELEIMDGGRYCEVKAKLEWREAVSREFDDTGQMTKIP